jgi:hemerythrin-like domain-containing protein
MIARRVGMSFIHRVTRMLHDEHMASVAMLNDLEGLLAASGRTAPDTSAAAVADTLAAIADVIEGEVTSHFAFEEEQLFTRLAEFGDDAIGQHLSEEHRAILPLGQALARMARTALTDGFTPEIWDRFRSRAGELVERMLAHIQKEEMALLPILDDVLDTETDFLLSERRGELS